MSTSYYLRGHADCCVMCRLFSKEVLIGTDSYWWGFSLKTYPDAGINTWDDWLEILNATQVFIVDESGCYTSLAELHETIKKSKVLIDKLNKRGLEMYEYGCNKEVYYATRRFTNANKGRF